MLVFLQLFVFVHNFERDKWEVVPVLDSDGGSQAIYGINCFVLQVKTEAIIHEKFVLVSLSESYSIQFGPFKEICRK